MKDGMQGAEHLALGERVKQSFGFMQGNILVVALATLLGQFSRSMVFPYASLYILALGGSAKEVGFVNSLAPLAGLVLFPLGGYLADRAGRVKLIAFSMYFSAATVLLYVFAPRWEWLALATFLRGWVVIQFPARSALIADSLAPEDRGRGIGAMSSISGLLSIVAPYLAGAVIDAYGANFGMRLLYGVMAALYLISGAVQQRFLVETAPEARNHIYLRDLPEILRSAYAEIPDTLRHLSPSLRGLAGVVVLSFVANAVASPFWVVYAVDQIGLSSSAWGLILLLETTTRNVLFLPAGWLVDRWGRTASLLAALGLALVSIPLFVFARGFWGTLLVRLAVAASMAVALPASSALMADMTPRAMRGRVMAALGQGSIMLGAAGGGTGGPATGFVVTIPLILASLAGGYLYAANPMYPWFFVAGATALAIFLTVFYIRDPQQAEV